MKPNIWRSARRSDEGRPRTPIMIMRKNSLRVLTPENALGLMIVRLLSASLTGKVQSSYKKEKMVQMCANMLIE